MHCAPTLHDCQGFDTARGIGMTLGVSGGIVHNDAVLLWEESIRVLGVDSFQCYLQRGQSDFAKFQRSS